MPDPETPATALLLAWQAGDEAALEQLIPLVQQELDPRKSQVVELRYFGGLTVEETAEVLRISPETVMRDWKRARVWLLRELTA